MEMFHFKTPAEFRQWLEENHARSEAIWLRLFKKTSGEPSITHAEALDQALCYGWIDGQLKPLDERSWLRKFSPRRPKSGWSKLNTRHIERLTAAGLMTPAGQQAVAAAQADGRWAVAYDSPRDAVPPPDFLAALARDKKAAAFFATLNKANVYAIVYRLQTAKKPETRQKRLHAILKMLSQAKAFHP